MLTEKMDPVMMPWMTQGKQAPVTEKHNMVPFFFITVMQLQTKWKKKKNWVMLFPVVLTQWVSARKMQLQCISNGVTSFLH